MREYQFHYTKLREAIILFLIIVVVFVSVAYVLLLLKGNELLLIVIELVIVFSLFHVLKKKAVGECLAKLSDTAVEFNFKTTSTTINFSDLLSFKAYYGKNGPVLYLNTSNNKFKLSVNSNYSETDSFTSFCHDIILQLDNYKTLSNPTLIHGGSIYATKGMVYFLSILTLIYLFGFLIETEKLRLYVGIGGGVYILLMWLLYLTNRRIKSR